MCGACSARSSSIVADLVLVLGGTRSGKSRHASEMARRLGGEAVTFIATARPGDPELDARIAEHRRHRPPAWTTVDTAEDLAATITGVPADDVILLDSVTLWLGASLDVPDDEAADRLTRAIDALRMRRRASIAVSDEVGLGLVPTTPSGRLFRDRLGLANQRLAGAADRVVLLVAGLPLELKPSR